MNLDRYVFGGGTALVTGAAGGMGAHVARELGDRGSHLALADRNGDDLATVAREIRAKHPRLTVTEHVVDLAETDQVHRLADEVRAAHAPLTLLVNNAGVALGGTFEQLDPEEFDWVMAINFRAPVLLTHLFLPDLLATPGSHIVNVSSLFGLIAPAGQTAYSSSKFGLRGFSEALRAELAGRCGVTTVHPGGIRTGIAKNARAGARTSQADTARGLAAFDKLLTFPADQAAHMIVESISHRKPRLLIGSSAVVPDVLARVTPAHYDRLLAVAFGQGRRRRRKRAGARAAAATTEGDSAGSPTHADHTDPAPGTAADERFVEVAGTRVRVRVTGPADAPVAVLVHGIGRSLEDFDDQHRLLSDRRRVVSLDLPGFGLTPPLPQATGMEAFADTVVGVLDALGIDGPVDLVGNSLGGAVCQYVLARHPERVRTLTLAASAGFGEEVILALRLLSVPVLGDRLLAKNTPESLRRTERSLYSDGAFVTRERLAHAHRVAQNPGRAQTFLTVARELGTFRGIRPQWRATLIEAIKAHPVPMLIVWGDRDLVLPAAHLDAAAREFPQAQTHRLENTGHLPQVERADEFAELLTRFWAGAQVAEPAR